MVNMMKHCDNCKLDIRDETLVCPLCAGPLCALNDTSYPPAYPRAMNKKRKYNLVKRILIFTSIVTSLVCIIVNIMVPTSVWWSLIAILVICYAWAVVPHALRRGGNLAGKVLMQVICVSALVVLIDMLLGWHAWSINYVIPVLISSAIAAVGVIIICYRTNWAGYVMYQTVLALFSFVPLVLCFTGLMKSFLFAIITSGFGICALVATIVFGDKSIKNEFKRRFRF